MKVSQAGKMALSAILSNKLRSFLTMLGIIIGVMAVTLLISLVQGASNTVTGQLDDLGGNQLIVQIINPTKRLTLSEVEALAEEEGVAYVSPTLGGNGTARAFGNSMDVSVSGITGSYKDVQGLDLESGRVITQTDNDYRLSVCVIGRKVATELFGTTACIGKNLRLNGKDYRIAGVLTEQVQTAVEDPNATVYIPLTNAQRLLSEVNVSLFYVAVEEEADMDAVKALLDRKLLAKYDDEDDYLIVNMADVIDIIDTIMGTLELLLAAIAGISLVVGGIGIMNIMLVSVTERTREIGIRKAIGAQRGDIIVQFMIESVILSLFGGIIGMAVSQAVLTTVNILHPGYNFAISFNTGAVALGFSILVGLVFGIYPAAKAAGLKPINALRYE